MHKYSKGDKFQYRTSTHRTGVVEILSLNVSGYTVRHTRDGVNMITRPMPVNFKDFDTWRYNNGIVITSWLNPNPKAEGMRNFQETPQVTAHCMHEMVDYIGMVQTWRYCKKCDLKER